MAIQELPCPDIVTTGVRNQQTSTVVNTRFLFCGAILARLLIYIQTLSSGVEVLWRRLAASGTCSSENWFDLTLSTVVNELV